MDIYSPFRHQKTSRSLDLGPFSHHILYSKLILEAGARNFSRTQSDSSPAYTPGLRLFAFPDRPAGVGAKEVALQGYRQSDPAAGQQAYGVPDRRG
jgi:hypothetical protein